MARITGTPTSFHQSQRHSVRMVDRIGGRDSFATGLIHGFVNGRGLDATLQFAMAASALKQSVAEVERLVAGDASGRV
jgi:2-dehydro-3-deoxygluconokinase